MKRILCLRVTRVTSLYSANTFPYVIQMVLLIGDDSDLRQVSGCLRVLRFPPPIKLTNTIELKYC